MGFFSDRSKQKPVFMLALDLGPMTQLSFAQHQQWHDLLLAGPTRNVVGTQSNDFPGLYYYDPRTQKEYVLMVSGPVDWRYASLGRRLHAELESSDYHLKLGLFSERALDPTVKLASSIAERVPNVPGTERDAMPDQWEALQTLVAGSFVHFPLPAPPSAIPNWSAIAASCLATLNKIKAKQDLKGGKEVWSFFQTFRYNRSTYQHEPEKPYGGTAELICHAGLAAALLSYARLEPRNSEAFHELGRELSIGIQHFFDTKSQFFQNSFSPEGEEWKRGVVDTWYAFNNLYQVIRVTLETREPKLVNSSLLAVERIIKFVHACHYEIPLFAKIAPAIKAGSASDGTIIGYALNPSVLGIYAALLIKSAELFPEKSTRYQEEALESLGRLHRWPLSLLFHEPVQLALAASAAHALGQKTLRDDFTRCLLLCCYRDGPNVGLFQGCAGQRYPAFRETVEAVQHLIEWMDEDPRSVPLRDIVTLSMCNTPKFLETTGDSKSLPKEGLQSIEQEKAAEIGVAIYAAPGIFELARIQVLGNIR